MPSTYLSLHYHLVFGTKKREPFMAAEWRSRLHAYLGGTISGLGSFPEGVGGVADHFHLVVGLKATHCLADVLHELKKASSAWVHEQIGVRSFACQEGYAAFTVSATARVAVQKYIADQEEHHRTTTFREEVIQMLERAGIEYDLNTSIDLAATLPGSVKKSLTWFPGCAARSGAYCFDPLRGPLKRNYLK